MFSEVEDWNKKYVHFKTDHLYDLKKVESFYEKHILEIIFKNQDKLYQDQSNQRTHQSCLKQEREDCILYHEFYECIYSLLSKWQSLYFLLMLFLKVITCIVRKNMFDMIANV